MSGALAERRLNAPRPVSAWVMSLVASATLWITGELELWVIPVQLLAFGASYWTRDDPPAWRQSPGWLNVFMFCITGVTIARALQGSPATLSLAYFAALSQGLQLVDARPRKSEFVLVALALFQVILASNLTDSVFFPPLVVVFLVTVVWTLLVHTLRLEAAAAGQRRAAQAVLTPALRRTAAALSALSVLLAAVFFLMLPRMKTSVLKGTLGPAMAVSGFSDQVSLGTIGRIRKDRRVVMRIETIEGESAPAGAGYWRGLAFDRFDGRQWSISPSPSRLTRIPITGIPRFGVVFGEGPGDGALVQRIVREPVDAGVLFAAGPVSRIEGPMQRIQRDPNGGVYHPSGAVDRVRYTLWTDAAQPSDAALAADRTAPPPEMGPKGEEYARRYLALPPLDPAVSALALRVTEGARSDAERLRALETYLRGAGRYTDEPPVTDDEAGGPSPVESFLLGDLAGHCEYFASGMVVLSRSLGMPARLVNGFAGGRINRLGGFTELARSDAHAWVEVHFEDAGWVRYDPTPPDLRWRGESALSLTERLAEVASVIELWWFQRVVDFDSSDQVFALRSAWHFVRDLRAALRFEGSLGSGTTRARVATAKPGFADVPWQPFALAALPLAGLWLLWRRRRPRRAGPVVLPEYRRALRLLARHRIRRDPSVTAKAFAREVASRVEPTAAASFERLTDAYLERRFGDGPFPRAEDLDGELAHLRAGLRNARRGEAQRAP